MKPCELNLFDGLFSILGDSNEALLLDDAQFVLKSIHKVGGGSGLLGLIRLGISFLDKTLARDFDFILDLRQVNDFLFLRLLQAVLVAAFLDTVLHEPPFLWGWDLLDGEVALQVDCRRRSGQVLIYYSVAY